MVIATPAFPILPFDREFPTSLAPRPPHRDGFRVALLPEAEIASDEFPEHCHHSSLVRPGRAGLRATSPFTMVSANIRLPPRADPRRGHKRGSERTSISGR